MGRPRKSDSERRSKVFYLRLLPREMDDLARAARERNTTVAGILREGAAYYLKHTAGGLADPPSDLPPAGGAGPGE